LEDIVIINRQGGAYMDKTRILFLCVHNTGRSQMAEALVNKHYGDRFAAESAGFDPGTEVNPLVVEAMKELGINLSGKKPRNLFDLLKRGDLFAYVVTVCDESSAQQCPVFPGVTTRLHWSFEDPSLFSGSRDEKLDKIRRLRDDIKSRIDDFIGSLKK
jgi:arsenate reductase